MQEPPARKKRSNLIVCEHNFYETKNDGYTCSGLKNVDELLSTIGKNISELDQNYNKVKEDIESSFLTLHKQIDEHKQKMLDILAKSYSIYSKIFVNTKETLEQRAKNETIDEGELKELNSRCMHTVFYSISNPNIDVSLLVEKFRVLINKKILYLPSPPTDLEFTNFGCGTFTLQWKTDPVQDKVIKECGCDKDIKYQVSLKEHGLAYPCTKFEFSTSKKLTRHITGVMSDKMFDVRVRTLCGQNIASEWSDVLIKSTPSWSEMCAWRECPSNVDTELKYVVDEQHRRIAMKEGMYGYYATVLCEYPLPLSVNTKWSIRVLETCTNNGDNVLIGVAPSVIDQNNNFNHIESGWYLNCGNMSLYSGPPQRYNSKKVPQFENVSITRGTVIDIFVNPVTHTISYSINGVTAEDVYTGLPSLIYPVVLLYFKGDSIELITY